MTKNKKPKSLYNFRLDTELIEQMRKHAEKHSFNWSDYLRKHIQNTLRKELKK